MDESISELLESVKQESDPRFKTLASIIEELVNRLDEIGKYCDAAKDNPIGNRQADAAFASLAITITHVIEHGTDVPIPGVPIEIWAGKGEQQ